MNRADAADGRAGLGPGAPPSRYRSSAFTASSTSAA